MHRKDGSLTRGPGPGAARTRRLFEQLLADGHSLDELLALARAQQRLETRRERSIESAEQAKRRAVASRVARFGRRVRCAQCGEEARVHTHAGERLRSLGCERCGGRLRPLTWRGWCNSP